MFRARPTTVALRALAQSSIWKSHLPRFNSSKPQNTAPAAKALASSQGIAQDVSSGTHDPIQQRTSTDTSPPLVSPNLTPPPVQTLSLQQGFAQHPIFVFNVAKRFLKFTVIGGVLLGTTAGIFWEGTHVWVEQVELALPQDDAEVRNWQWNMEGEKWSGDLDAAGTDPGLGIRGRHLVRAAWMAQHWEADQSTIVLSSESMKSDDPLLGPRGIAIIDPRLVKAEDFLRTAIAIAEQRTTVRPWTLHQLLVLHASVLERMGSASLITARTQYERAWACQPTIAANSARLALKLGDLTHRLGDDESALAWWKRAIHITQGGSSNAENGVPATMPSSPYSQRTLLSTLSSLSAFYATAGKLPEAQSIAESSLDLIRSVRQPESISSVSTPHALHAFTLLQRSSVLAIHLAEVLYAQKKPTAISTQWLRTAAESSERVLRLLPQHSDSNSSSISKPAQNLSRDALRTAAEAWNLLGILTEDKDPRGAFDAYQKAVSLVGSKEQYGKPADKTLQTDWEVFWGNYTRLKHSLEPEPKE